jgi:hypothetical protein
MGMRNTYILVAESQALNTGILDSLLEVLGEKLALFVEVVTSALVY